MRHFVFVDNVLCTEEQAISIAYQQLYAFIIFLNWKLL